LGFKPTIRRRFCCPSSRTAEREELARLRKENRELRTERDILKKAAAFFAKHQQ
jgi:transposase-like protein